MHEWPVALLRDSMRFFAHAAFFVLRALAARVRLVRYGLRPAVRCKGHQGPLWVVHVLKDDNGSQIFRVRFLRTAAVQVS